MHQNQIIKIDFDDAGNLKYNKHSLSPSRELYMHSFLLTNEKFSNKEICLICHIAAGLHANKIGNDKIFDIRSLYKALDLILK